ncbi:MAG: hypothetical protein ABI743_09450 [bacterium]
MGSTIKPSPFVGVGLYSYSEAARLLGRDYGWINRLLRTLEAETGHGPDLASHDSPIKLITFLELVECFFVDAFMDAGVKRSRMRVAARSLAEKYRSGHPFALHGVSSDCLHIFADLEEAVGRYTRELSTDRAQLVDPRLLPIKKRIELVVEYDNAGLASRLWPMAAGRSRGRIVLDPHRHFGQPLDASTGVPTQALFAAWQAEGAVDFGSIAKWYRVPVDAVRAAVEFESILDQQRQAA